MTLDFSDTSGEKNIFDFMFFIFIMILFFAILVNLKGENINKEEIVKVENSI